MSNEYYNPNNNADPYIELYKDGCPIQEKYFEKDPKTGKIDRPNFNFQAILEEYEGKGISLKDFAEIMLHNCVACPWRDDDAEDCTYNDYADKNA